MLPGCSSLQHNCRNARQHAASRLTHAVNSPSKLPQESVIEALDYSALLQTIHRRCADGEETKGRHAGKRDKLAPPGDVRCGFSSVCSYLQTEKKKKKKKK